MQAGGMFSHDDSGGIVKLHCIFALQVLALCEGLSNKTTAQVLLRGSSGLRRTQVKCYRYRDVQRVANQNLPESFCLGLC